MTASGFRSGRPTALRGPRATVRGGQLSVLVEHCKRGPKVPCPFCHGVTARARVRDGIHERGGGGSRLAVGNRRSPPTLRAREARGLVRSAHKGRGISRYERGRAAASSAPVPPWRARAAPRRSSRGGRGVVVVRPVVLALIGPVAGVAPSSANSPNSARCGAPFGPSPSDSSPAAVDVSVSKADGSRRAVALVARAAAAAGHRRDPRGPRAPAPGPESACPRAARRAEALDRVGALALQPLRGGARPPRTRGRAGCRCSCAACAPARASGGSPRSPRARAAARARAPARAATAGPPRRERDDRRPPRPAAARARARAAWRLGRGVLALLAAVLALGARAAAPSDGARANRASGGIVDKDVVEAPGLPKSKMSETQRPTEVSGEPGGWTSAIPVRALPGFAARFQAVIFTHLSPGGSPYEPATLRR